MLLQVSIMLKIAFIIAALASLHSTNGEMCIKPTKGESWPKPQEQTQFQDFYIILPSTFEFRATNEETGCPNFLKDALKRYSQIIEKIAASVNVHGLFKTRKQPEVWLVDGQEGNFLGYLKRLDVTLEGVCASETIIPDSNMEETYKLILDTNEHTLTSESIWGILRGLETFVQLIYLNDNSLHIKATIVYDYPRFPHRGLLLDTASHFISVQTILQILDAMSVDKLNVFHWHIVDVQSFPYESLEFPELSLRGAYDPISKVYTINDVEKIIEHARLRGIRIIPEFTVPSRTQSWGKSHPELLLKSSINSSTTCGLDPTNDEVYKFLFTLFQEISVVFPDSYLHIGGDFPSFDCWKINPHLQQFMSDNLMNHYTELENYFIKKVMKITRDVNLNVIVWEDAYIEGVDMPDLTIVQVWSDRGDFILPDVTQEGILVIYSACWHLSDVQKKWREFYDCDPVGFMSEEDNKLVVGGEALMWTGSVDEDKVIDRIWPRVSAVAEILWSAQSDGEEVQKAAGRIEEHFERLRVRGIGTKLNNRKMSCQ